MSVYSSSRWQPLSVNIHKLDAGVCQPLMPRAQCRGRYCAVTRPPLTPPVHSLVLSHFIGAFVFYVYV